MRVVIGDRTSVTLLCRKVPPARGGGRALRDAFVRRTPEVPCATLSPLQGIRTVAKLWHRNNDDISLPKVPCYNIILRSKGTPRQAGLNPAQFTQYARKKDAVANCNLLEASPLDSTFHLTGRDQYSVLVERAGIHHAQRQRVQGIVLEQEQPSTRF